MPAHVLLAAIVSAIAVVVSAGAPPHAPQSTSRPTLRQVAAFELPGPPGKRFDYLAIDEDDNYLLSAHLGAGLLHVIDLRTNAVVKSIAGVPGIEGVAYIAEGKKVYTANWGENTIGVVDLGRMAVVKRIPTERKPDGIAYAPPFHKAYVSNEQAKAESIIDVTTDRIVKVLRFDSETGVPQCDPVARRVYVNLQDRNTFAVIDPANDTVVARHRVKGCVGNHGMAIDAERRRAFLSCEGNDTLTVFDLDANRAVAHLPTAKGADVVMFDQSLGRIYVACSSGVISVFQMDDPAHFLLPSTLPHENGVGVEAIGIVSGKLAPFTVHVNGGGGLDRDDRHALGICGVIGELPVHQKLRIVGEVNGERTQGERPNNSALLGFIWQPPSKNLLLDAGVRHGISHAAPDWQFTIGLTFGFSMPGAGRE